MLWCQRVACLIMQELNWLPRMVLALTVKEPSKKGPKFAGPAAAVLHLYPRFHLDLASRLGTYPLHQVWLPPSDRHHASPVVLHGTLKPGVNIAGEHLGGFQRRCLLVTPRPCRSAP